jgi:sulfatase maturation enzyme AslB (radical SAM superfamily)
LSFVPLKRKIRSVDRRVREARLIARALKSPRHPVVAHIVPIRRCNLSCAYCNEYDKVSEAVPTAVMLGRIDLLAGLGTAAITISGGEPLLHPNSMTSSGAFEHEYPCDPDYQRLLADLCADQSVKPCRSQLSANQH